MDRGSRIGTADRRAAGPAHSPRPHPGDERRKLPSETEQTQAGLPAELLIRPLPASTVGRHPPRQTRLGEEDVFRCGLNAPPFRRRRAPVPTPPAAAPPATRSSLGTYVIPPTSLVRHTSSRYRPRQWWTYHSQPRTRSAVS